MINKLEIKSLAYRFSSCASGALCTLGSLTQLYNFENLSPAQHLILLGVNVALAVKSHQLHNKSEQFLREAFPKPA